MLNFPVSPTNGQQYNAEDRSWQWSAAKAAWLLVPVSTTDANLAASSAASALSSAQMISGDRTQTGLDRTQTGLDRAATVSSAATATLKAAEALSSSASAFASSQTAATAKTNADIAAAASLVSQGLSETARVGAEAARNTALAAAGAIGPLKFYATKALATAALASLANGDLVEIAQDESLAGARTRYKKDAGALVFVVNLDQLRIDLDVPTGSGLVGFVAKGASAIARTLQEKNRDIVSFEDFGAAGDGTADDSSAVTKAITTSDIVVGACGSSSLSGVQTLGPRTKMLCTRLIGKAGILEFLRSASNNANLLLLGVELTAQAGTGIQFNTPNGKDAKIIGSNINADGYGILSNALTTGSENTLVLGSTVRSYKTDAIEWNNPAGTTYRASVIGSFLHADTGSVASTGGFAVGIAGTQQHITLGNHIKYSRRAAIHIEDKQTQGVIANNTAICGQDGITIQAGASSSGDGVVVAGNQITGPGATSNGIWNINDANGKVELSAIVGNRVRDFLVGYNIDGSGIQATAANISVNCGTGVRLPAGGRVFGEWYSKDTPILASAGGGGVVGKLISSTIPTDILVKTGTNMPGPYAKGFAIPFAVAHIGANSLQNFAICKKPSVMAGRISVRLASGTTGGFYSANLVYDGVTIVLSDVVTKISGTISVFSLVDDGAGNIALRFFSASALTTTGFADFDGVYHVNA